MPSEFNWKDYHKLAVKLKDRNKNKLQEACLRSAISRAYYALHNLLQNYAVEELGCRPNTEHSDLVVFYKNQSNRKLRKIGMQLDRALKNRNRCDYDNVMGMTNLKRKTKEVVNNKTQKIINFLNE